MRNIQKTRVVRELRCIRDKKTAAGAVTAEENFNGNINVYINIYKSIYTGFTRDEGKAWEKSV